MVHVVRMASVEEIAILENIDEHINKATLKSVSTENIEEDKKLNKLDNESGNYKKKMNLRSKGIIHALYAIRPATTLNNPV